MRFCLFIHPVFTTTGIHRPLADPQKVVQWSWKLKKKKPSLLAVCASVVQHFRGYAYLLSFKDLAQKIDIGLMFVR